MGGGGMGMGGGGMGMGGGGARMDPQLAAIVQQLNESERQQVTQLCREGFDAGDVCQIFLICDKDIERTRETLRSWK
jgi:hypothetical protein